MPQQYSQQYLRLFILLSILSIVLVGCDGDEKNGTSTGFTGEYGLKFNLEGSDQGVQSITKSKADTNVLPLYQTIYLENYGSVEVGAVSFKGQADLDGITLKPIAAISDAIPAALRPGQAQQRIIRAQIDVGDVSKYAQIGATRFSTIISACYPYKTKFTGLICLDSDPNTLTDETGCQTKNNYVFSGGQAAPVGITNVDYSATPLSDNIRHDFFIAIRTMDTAVVKIAKLDFDLCAADITAEDRINNEWRVTLAADSAKFGGVDLTCDETEIILRDKQTATFHCSSESANNLGSNVQTPLQFTLNYAVESRLPSKSYELTVLQ